MDPLPFYAEPPESEVRTPELFAKYPLVMVTGRRSPVFFHAEHRNIPWLREAVSVPDRGDPPELSGRAWHRRGGVGAHRERPRAHPAQGQGYSDRPSQGGERAARMVAAGNRRPRAQLVRYLGYQLQPAYSHRTGSCLRLWRRRLQDRTRRSQEICEGEE